MKSVGFEVVILLLVISSSGVWNVPVIGMNEVIGLYGMRWPSCGVLIVTGKQIGRAHV